MGTWRWRAFRGFQFALWALLLSSSARVTFAQAPPAGRCPVDARGVGILKGTVLDDETGLPVSGAVVAWTADALTVSGTTDDGGSYAFAVPEATVARGQRVAVTVRANPYRGRSGQAAVCPGASTTLAFRLRRLPPAAIAVVTGRVVNETQGRGVPGAVVSIARGTLPLEGLSAVTDSNGSYQIPGVGRARGLTLDMRTAGPPCLAPASRPLPLLVAAHQVTQDFVEPEVATIKVRCPPEDGPEVVPETAAKPVAAATPQRLTPPSALPDDPSVVWHLASVDGIQTNAAEEAWNAGHVNAIVKVGPQQAILGSDCGGVFSLGWTSASAAAIPVSYPWVSNCVTALAQQPDGIQHVYAATQDAGDAGPGGFLFETDTSSISPLTNWVQVTPKPPCSSIYSVVTDPLLRRIVLACDVGIWWSPIPGAPSAHGSYSWTLAQPASTLPANALMRNFSSLALGPPPIGAEGASIVAGVNGGHVPNDVIFYGQWSGGNLVFDAASVPSSGILPSRTSVASCPADPHQMYAATADYNNGFFLGAVWRSVDGGQSWSAVSMPASAGNQGFYNNVVTVAPSDCLEFALGWRDHVFVSFDGGGSYTPLDLGCNPAAKLCNGHLHTDYHAVIFDPNDPTTVFVGSDGGVASATGVFNGSTPVVSSYFNEHLPNLEFGNGDASPGGGSGFGGEAGLLTGALQDNGVLYNDLLGGGRWLPVLQGDGITATFAGVGPGASSQDDTLVRSNNSGSTTLARSVYDGTSMLDNGVIPLGSSPAGVEAGGPGLLARVQRPSYNNAQGQLMYMVGAGSSDPSVVYGLFANTDGSGMHWERLASVGANLVVSALSSANGTTIFAGTAQGTIHSIQPDPVAKATVLQWPITAPSQAVGSIRSVAELFSSLGFAATNGGSVLVFNGQTWNLVGGGLPTNLPFTAVAAADTGWVFAATRQQVYVTHDLGGTWLIASTGLPAVAQAESLRYVVQPDGSRFLYLATYGWSMFRTRLPNG